MEYSTSKVSFWDVSINKGQGGVMFIWICIQNLRMLISIWILSLVISRPGGGHSVCQAVRLRRICSLDNIFDE